MQHLDGPQLPAPFARWFTRRGWAPRAHQLALLAEVQAGRSALLIAPTGGGKTLAGFLPSLTELAARPAGERAGLHTLYLSPLKALAVDVARNVGIPVQEMGLPIRLETRSGDTSQHKRQRQRTDPPDILLTTPEQLALLLAYPTADQLFAGLRYVVLDELHALAPSKRGDLLALGLARLSRLAPGVKRIGLSATVANPERLRRYLMPQHAGDDLSALVQGAPGAPPQISVMMSEAEIPWAGHMARHALGEVLTAIRAHGTSLVFVNTRAQAEFVFQQLWRLNEDALPIALHHGSLSPEQRRKVEAAMAAGSLRAVVCTSTLDLGIDWGAVDLVIHVGAPKGASRLIQRIGRANHRLDEPSQALLVPSNRFEVMECEAARAAAMAGMLDAENPRAGGLDVLAQHVLGTACAGPFAPGELYREVISAAPYADLPREDFDRVVEFVATGGYALKTYERYRKLMPETDGRYRLAHPRLAQAYRLNAGTIVEEPMVKVKLLKRRPRPNAPPRGGFSLGEIEEYFIEQMCPGDTFLFGGHVLRFEALVETEVLTTKTNSDSPMIPSYAGGKFPLSTHLAERVRAMLADPESSPALPAQVRDWLSLQRVRSKLPRPNELLVETFPRGARFYLVAYPFEGRLAHQTLGMLLTRRLERQRMRPMGFVANDYALAVWGLRDMGTLNMGELFGTDMLGDDLESWMAESALLKRTFRHCAIISGLIPKRIVGAEKTGRQMTVSSDLIYDVLRAHEPDHILLKATYADAAAGLLDIGRLNSLLARIAGHVVLKRLSRISPLAVPIMLEIGREPVYGEASEVLLAEAAHDLAAEALDVREGAA
jgi:ATP-dependent Lhr-like helicase